MENEKNLSVAVIELTKDSYKKLETLNEQVLDVAKAQPDLMIIPRYTHEPKHLESTRKAAMQGNPFIALFTQTRFGDSKEQHAQRIDPWSQYTGNPMRDWLMGRYAVQDFPQKGMEGLGLDLIVLFGGEEIKRETPVFKSIRPDGYLIWVDEQGDHVVFKKHLKEKIPGLIGENSYNSIQPPNAGKNIKNCSWYDLKF